jgi:PAS domain S-box-containing protein
MLTDAVSKAVLVSAPEGIFVSDREGRIVLVNSAAELPTGRLGLEHKGFRKDRGEIHLQVSLAYVDAEDGPLACYIVRKMAAARQQDQTLSELNDHFRQMVENSYDILTIRDAECRIRYTSPSFHRVMRYKQEEMIGSTGFELIHPEDRPSVENALNEFWKNPGARDSIEYRAKHANGTWISLEVVAYNMLDHPAVRAWSSTAATSAGANTRKRAKTS